VTGGPAGSPAGLPPETRELLLAVLRAELACACARALAEGAAPQALADSLDARVARLRSRGCTAIGGTAENVPHGPDHPVHLRRIVE
jgi:hypothetical protein